MTAPRPEPVLRLLVLMLLLAATHLLHPVPARATRSAIYVDDKSQNYLMKFGYLPQSDFETGNLRTDEQLRDAIKSLQRFGGIAETGVVDESTQKLMLSRRCGLPDKPDLRLHEPSLLRRPKRFTLHGSKWDHLNLTWSLRTDRPSGLDTGGVRRELSRALGVWAKNSQLVFQEVNSDKADILIYFHRGYHGDGYPFDGKGRILAHAFFPGSDNGGDAHFDEEEEWVLGNYNNEEGTSLFAVAAHEFGHSLGLAHSSVQGALMYPWYQGITENFELPEDDRNGIQQHYGSPDKLWGKIPDYPRHRPGRPSLPSSTSTTTTTSTTQRPWRTRPREPWGTPSWTPPGRERPHWPNHYPSERPPRIPNWKPDWPSVRPTTTTTTTTTTTQQPPSPRWPPRQRPQPPSPGPTSTTTRRTSTTRPSHRRDLPDKCDTSYDAITLIRRELFIFRGRYVWRLNDRGVVDGFPAEIGQLFRFPVDVEHIDAVYERVRDGRIVFFVGRLYYVFNTFYLEPGYPKPIAHLGLPDSLDRIDAAMVWGYNKRTYFFSGSMYWRFDESVNYVELDYPRDISMFAGVGRSIDAVFQWKNGTTYFFKGKHFWQFDDMRMRVAQRKPKSSAHYWMGCPRGVDTNDVDLEPPTRNRFSSSSSSDSGESTIAPPRLLLVVPILLALLSATTSLRRTGR